MQDKFNIGIFGLHGDEISALRHVVELHNERTWIYTLVESKEKRRFAEIFLVDLDSAVAQLEWKLIEQMRPDAKMFAIFISAKEKKLEKEISFFSRPIRISHLLKEIDNILIHKLNYVPPIAEDTFIQRVEFNVEQTSDEVTLTGTMFKYRALVIDDSESVQTLMNVSLRAFLIKPDITDNGEEALKWLKENKYHIIFVDIMLPGRLDGYEICKKIKKQNHGKEIPVVILSSKQSALDKVKGTLSGANSYLTKPLAQNELETVLKKYLTI